LKTTCPSCATTFRVTPAQLAVRAGKVRCGKCQSIFNAIDQLLDRHAAPPSDTSLAGLRPTDSENSPASRDVPETKKPLDFFITDDLESNPDISGTPDAAGGQFMSESEIQLTPPTPPIPLDPVADADDARHAQALASTLTLASPLTMPRATTEIPGYSKWTEGAFNSPTSFHDAKPARWPFTLVAVLLGFALVGQLVFHFRTAIASAAPSLRPPLEVLSQLLGTDIPLPRHVELISIETSDLQVDPKQSSLLALQATLRNRAAHDQAYPALQLSLTDTQDSVIVRRVFSPGEYLSPQNLSPLIFTTNAEVSVRLWIEAKETAAAGYRLYVFYP
jgi:predicted Zn finger-like uncharacterized protein